MRELKFRAWNSEWQDFVYADFKDCMYWEKREFGIEFAVGFSHYPQEGWIFNQYTGLKDKNGTEIYEGDIVMVANQWDKINFGREVTYEKKVIEWGEADEFETVQGWLPFIQPGSIDCSFIYSATDVEVIGNIYENPELITDNTREP